MVLSGNEFYTRNLELQKYIDRLCKDFYVEMPPRYAQEFSRHRIVQKGRELNKITIAEDHKFKRSVIKIKEPLRIRKEGNRYLFEFSL